MRTPSFRTSLASSVIALIMAFYPGVAIVNADTTTGPAVTPQPPTATQTAETTAPPAPATTTATEAPPAATSATPSPTQPVATDSSSASPTPTETSATPAQQTTPATTSTATTPSEPATSQPTNPDSGMAPQNATSNSTAPSTITQDSTATPQPTPNISSTSPNASATPAPTPTSATLAAPTSTSNNIQDATINGTISETSKSGDANATQNTTVGNVTSGDASAITNLFNLVQSSANFLDPGNQLKTFTADIQGDVVGDLLLDPGQISNLTASGSTKPLGSVTVNNQANAAINTTINLDAQSGSATAANNTTVGNTTTGNANAMANVVNMINSTIGAGQSFMGAINIYGNLDGDILLPPGFLDTLLASNSQPTSPANSVPSSTQVSQVNNQTITNTINASAQSGTALVLDNTKVGNVATGNALTNLTVLNLSSSDVIGANNLLVFVNVLGKWYGVIMDAPAGTTAASLGGGITQNKSLTQAQDTTTRSTSNSVINNDINVRARSGDALVTKNTTAGNATTGNATASVNLVNFIGNHLALSDWFGVLFINVFGTWKGSFGIDTAAGGTTNPSNPSPSGNHQTGSTPTQARVFKFVPNGSGQGTKTASGSAPYHLEPVFMGDQEMNQPEQSETDNVPTVLTSTVVTKGEPKTIFKPTPSEDKKQMASWVMPVAGLTLGSLLIIGERIVAMRRKEQ